MMERPAQSVHNCSGGSNFNRVARLDAAWLGSPESKKRTQMEPLVLQNDIEERTMHMQSAIPTPPAFVIVECGSLPGWSRSPYESSSPRGRILRQTHLAPELPRQLPCPLPKPRSLSPCPPEYRTLHPSYPLVPRALVSCGTKESSCLCRPY